MKLILTGLILLVGFVNCVVFNVCNSSALNAAFKNVKAGDVINLADNYYSGNLSFRKLVFKRMKHL